MTDATAVYEAKPHRIEVNDFEANIDHCVAAAEAGRKFVLTRNGIPLLTLIPADR